MTEQQKYLLTGLGIGAVAAGLLVGAFTMTTTTTDDDDRPPIIVRGGSLIFQSDENGKPGKPWKRKGPNGPEWKPDHERGHWVGFFGVEFDGGSGACGPAYTPELIVYYRPGGEASVESVFQITRQPRNNQGNDKKLEPVVVGDNLVVANTPVNPTLTFDAQGQGTIARVEIKSGPQTQVTCVEPAGLKVHMVR